MNQPQKLHRYADPRYNEDEDRMIPIIDADGRINQRMVVDTRKSELKILKDKNRRMKMLDTNTFRTIIV